MTFDFGQYQGQRPDNVPTHYLEWFRKSIGSLTADERRYIDRVLQRRANRAAKVNRLQNNPSK